MSPDIVERVIIIGNPIAMMFLGVVTIKLGKRMGQPIFVAIGKITFIAAPIFLLVGILGLVAR
jgi:putative Ca2+/H+ antiporter (TMEM165/GDT1 family)